MKKLFQNLAYWLSNSWVVINTWLSVRPLQAYHYNTRIVMWLSHKVINDTNALAYRVLNEMGILIFVPLFSLGFYKHGHTVFHLPSHSKCKKRERESPPTEQLQQSPPPQQPRQRRTQSKPQPNPDQHRHSFFVQLKNKIH